MATARKLTVDNDIVGIYNCTSRCVRRAFLCGFDSYIDKDYDSNFVLVLSGAVLVLVLEKRLPDHFRYSFDLRETMKAIPLAERNVTIVDQGPPFSSTSTSTKLKLDKRGSLPGNLKSVLAQYDLDAEQWTENVHNLGGLFYQFIGKVDRLKALAKAKGVSWFCGKQGAKKLYRKPVMVN